MTGTAGHTIPQPLWGQADQAGNVDLLPTLPSTWANTALEFTLPSPGAWWVEVVAWANICATTPPSSSTNQWVNARVVDVASGAAVLTTEVIAQHQVSTDPTTRFQSCRSGAKTLVGVVEVTSAQVARTLRLQGGLRQGGLTGGATLDASTMRASRAVWSRL